MTATAQDVGVLTMVNRAAARPVVLDIETVPTEAALAMPYPEDRSPPGNMSKPETIAKWREQDRIDWQVARIKEYSLNPRLGRVLCVGYALPCSDGPAYSVDIAKEADEEPEILKLFWQIVAQHEGKVVTWNGTWDLRFLVLRSLHHGVLPTLSGETVRMWFAKYRVTPHFDVKAALTNWNPVDGHLDDWASFCGFAAKEDGITGKDVYGLYQAGEYRKIVEYCKSDVAATLALYGKVRNYFIEAA